MILGKKDKRKRRKEKMKSRRKKMKDGLKKRFKNIRMKSIMEKMS